MHGRPTQEGKTRLVVTHSRRHAAAAGLLLRLDVGRIVYFGPPEGDPLGLWQPGLQQEPPQVRPKPACCHACICSGSHHPAG